MVVGKGIATLILKEDAGHTTLRKGIVVAIARQLASVKALEIVFIAVYTLHQLEALHTWVANLAILHGVVVSNHIEVEEIFNLL